MAIPCPFKGCKSQIASRAKLPGHYAFKHKGKPLPGTSKETKPTKRRKYTRRSPVATTLHAQGPIPSIVANGGTSELMRPPGAAEQMRDLAATLETKAKLLKSMADDLDRIG